MEPKKPNRYDHGKQVSAAATVRKNVAATIAAASLSEERALDLRGNNKPITDDELDDCLLRLSHGEPMATVTANIGVNRSALLSRASLDPEFRDRLRNAQEMGAFAIVENTLRVANGDPGFTTGSIERDKLKVDTAWKWGKTIGNRIFGDKLQVDQRSITISIDRDSADW